MIKFRLVQITSIHFEYNFLNSGIMFIIFYESAENFVGKGENADQQHFLLFPQGFHETFSTGSLKLWIVW